MHLRQTLLESYDWRLPLFYLDVQRGERRYNKWSTEDVSSTGRQEKIECRTRSQAD